MGVPKVFANGLEIRTSGVFVRNGPILLRFAAPGVHARRTPSGAVAGNRSRRMAKKDG